METEVNFEPPNVIFPTTLWLSNFFVFFLYFFVFFCIFLYFFVYGSKYISSTVQYAYLYNEIHFISQFRDKSNTTFFRGTGQQEDQMKKPVLLELCQSMNEGACTL